MWVCVALLLIAGTLAVVHTALTTRDASLRLKVQHSLRSAQLSVWVDDELAYSGKLTGTAKKKFGLISEPVQGTFWETLSVSSGVHRIRVRTVEGNSVQENIIAGNFERNSQRTLCVTARSSDISLAWQSASSFASESSLSGSGGWQRYTSTLLLTAAGSIISALAGFAIREVPKHIASRQSAAPKI